MPHAVILGASRLPRLDAPLAREGSTIHKITEVTEGTGGWLLKSLIVHDRETLRFFTRVERRDDDLVIHLDDHMHIERTPHVFDHLAILTRKILDANKGSTLGATNLQDRIPA